MTKQFLLASDFDQTLSFNDSGVALSELIGFHGFHDKVKGLSDMNLVQQGAELSYLILHDPDFRKVRREHLVETGKRIRLKHDVALFARALENLHLPKPGDYDGDRRTLAWRELDVRNLGPDSRPRSCVHSLDASTPKER